MHSSKYKTMTLQYDGDMVGPMYLISKGTEIIVTPSLLSDSLSAHQGFEDVCIEGPDHKFHDRHEVTVPPIHSEIKFGNWKTATVSIARSDIEEFLIDRRVAKILALAERVSDADGSFLEMASTLDSVISQLENI